METIKTGPDQHAGGNADSNANAARIVAVEIADNIERTVERTALRKVRRLVDDIQQQDVSQRAIQKHVIAAALTCIVAFFALQAWQKTQQHNADRARDAIYACEYRASLDEMPQVRDALVREQPHLDPLAFKKELLQRQALVWTKVRRQCMTAGSI